MKLVYSSPSGTKRHHTTIYLFLSVLIPIIFISCATAVIITTENQPLVNMQDMKTITVIPLEWNKNIFPAYDLTRIFITHLKKAEAFEFIEPSIIKDLDKSNYWEYVDVYIEAEIVDIVSQRQSKRGTTKEVDGKETKTTDITRTVTVVVAYKYIRAIDGEILGDFYRTVESSYTIGYADAKSLPELLFDLNMEIGHAVIAPDMLTLSAIQQLPAMMANELNVISSITKKEILNSKNNNPMFKKAKKLVRQKKYPEAIIIYKSLYEQTGSGVAGYNLSLLLEANNQLTEALAVMEEMYNRISRTGEKVPLFIQSRVEVLRLKINIS